MNVRTLRGTNGMYIDLCRYVLYLLELKHVHVPTVVQFAQNKLWVLSSASDTIVSLAYVDVMQECKNEHICFKQMNFWGTQTMQNMSHIA